MRQIEGEVTREKVEELAREWAEIHRPWSRSSIRASTPTP